MSQQDQPLSQKSAAQLHQELQLRIQHEIEAHNITRTLLMHTQNNARYWDHQALLRQGQMSHLEMKLAATETQCQELIRENGRLNLIVRHLVSSLPACSRTGV